MNTEAQDDQVKAVVAARGAVPVHDAGDAAVGRENVAGMEVAVHSVLTEEVPEMFGADPGDPAFERGGASAELAKWFVQAVSGAVIAQVELVGGYVAAVSQCVRLHAVHLDHPIEVADVKAVDLRAGQQLLDRDDGMPDLGG
jgi:hypothetical protein